MEGLEGQVGAELDSASALLSFECTNVRSYRDTALLSLVAGPRSDPQVARVCRVAGSPKPVRVLPGLGLFGANASGKTTLLRALTDMRMLVLGSFRNGSTGTPLPRRPFLLDDVSESRPSSFAIEVLVDGVRWQYGFEFSNEKVTEEYAYHYPLGKRRVVFERSDAEITFGRGMGSAMRDLVRQNSLVLSTAGAARESLLTPLFGWFMTNLTLADASSRDLRTARTVDLMQTDANRARVLHLIQAADLGIADIESIEPDPEDVVRIERALRILSGAEQSSEGDSEMEFIVEDLLRLTHCGDAGCKSFGREDESLGTLVWVGLIGPVIDALDSGSVLLADELDASLHPLLVERIIDLFQDESTNPRLAQIVFNAHDTTVLGDSSGRLLRRDQIWFTEKAHSGQTALIPLLDYRPRKDEALQPRYLQGRYGGVPVIDRGAFTAASRRDQP